MLLTQVSKTPQELTNTCSMSRNVCLPVCMIHNTSTLRNDLKFFILKVNNSR